MNNYNNGMVYPAGYERTQNDSHNNSDDEEFYVDDDSGFVFDFQPFGKDSTTTRTHTTEVESNDNSFQVTSDNYYKTNDKNDKSDIQNDSDYSYTYKNDQFDEIMEQVRSSVSSNDLKNVRNLIESHQLDVDYEFDSSWTLLMFAVAKNNIEIAQYLIEIGANVNFCNGNIILTKIKV
jgi:ankyrin repeat protein